MPPAEPPPLPPPLPTDALADTVSNVVATTVVASVTASVVTSVATSVAITVVGSVSTSVGASVGASVVGATVASSVAAGSTTTTFAASAASALSSATGVVASSTAGSTAAGGAASSAASSFTGGATSGSITALLLGAQRFQAISTLAANVSETQSAVARSLSWASGDFGLLRPAGDVRASGGHGRALSSNDTIDADNAANAASTADAADPASDGPAALASLQSMVLTFGLVFFTTFAAPLCVMSLWRRRVNRRYYRIRRDLRQSLEHDKLLFRSFPSVFVLPGLPLLACFIFATGMTSRAAELLTTRDDACGLGCRWTAIAALTGVATFLLAAYVILIDFHARFRKRSWSPVQDPTEPSAVSDPLYRLVAKLHNCCRERRPTRALRSADVASPTRTWRDRPRGAFLRPPDETREPARTERLLALPIALLRPKASDTLDAVGFALMARSGGDSFVALCFEMVILTAGVALSLMSGCGRGLEPRSAGAIAQLSGALGVQLGVVGIMACANPSNDRMMSLLVGVQVLAFETVPTSCMLHRGHRTRADLCALRECYQFACEAAMTGVMLLDAALPQAMPSGMMQECTFILSLASVLAPVAQRAHDAVVVQGFKLLRKDSGFSLKGACFAMVGCLVFIPSVIVTLLDAVEGVERVGDVDSADMKVAEAAMDDVNKMANKTATQGVVKQVKQRAEERAAMLFQVAGEERSFRSRRSTQTSVANVDRDALSVPSPVAGKVAEAARAFKRLSKPPRQSSIARVITTDRQCAGVGMLPDIELSVSATAEAEDVASPLLEEMTRELAVMRVRTQRPPRSP